MLMALTVAINKYASSNLQALHKTQQRKPPSTLTTITNNVELGRRSLILSTLIATTQVPESRTQLLQKYLKKSEENKDKNDKERLESYYKRNYKDYFDLMEGTLRAKNDEQLSDTEKGILDWLQRNK
ncbi:hypothetical protein HN51_056892 [Arachis hypogaea]|uniref:Uncharacterized protein n=1 Tax=Arachis hypogaea TaxID=3818 RepID=A0A444XVG0_ARAHY|nr:uncharacterized protein LOC107619771 [Arachis ipaensis]XP_025677020.1 uncharacterized protein LOC112776954 [Arachis hypogaea]QHN79856.1 uncharacterized protein DS421_19g673520 [Arachis hypogaea]RYQ93786.1 hypothetical protein Ahy_B09g100025 isoform A [Arachis hypogaea]RYQ93787.1 hypothetical protein Ahy_B09g100025 isoform B [Arachis hypogaea]